MYSLLSAEVLKLIKEIQTLDRMIKECQELTEGNDKLLAEILNNNGVERDDSK